MDAHEKECALTAMATLLERATSRKGRKELRQNIREIEAAPLIGEPIICGCCKATQS